MDYWISIYLLKFELLVLLVSLGYAFYFAVSKFHKAYLILRSIVKPTRLVSAKDVAVNEVKSKKKENISHSEYKKEVKELNEQETREVKDLIKRIILNKSRGEFEVAKNLIIEALSLDKFNKEINLELASLYILEEDYLKAEYIYKDLLLVHDNDFDILKKLGFVLSHQDKYQLAIEMYKKAYNINKFDHEVINMIAHLSFVLEDYLEAVEYFKKYIKERPRDAENLTYLASSYRAMGNHREALIQYKKVLDIEPYNEVVKKAIWEIETPEILETLK